MIRTPKLIAIHGLKGSGKDLTAHLLQHHVVNYDKFAFGLRLKQICAAIWGLPIEAFQSDQLKEKPICGVLTSRIMMTTVQTIIKDAFGDDFFAKLLVPAWSAAEGAGRSLIVTDLRFDVELKLCRTLGATVIHVLRPVTDLYADFTHESERGLPIGKSDLTLLNSQGKDYLRAQVRNAVIDIWGSDALPTTSYAILKPY